MSTHAHGSHRRALLPPRSTGVRSAPFGDGLVLHDDRRAEIHVLNASGALVWAACDGATGLDELAAEVAAASGVDAARVADEVAAHVDELERRGLVGRGDVPPPVELPSPEVVGGDVAGPTLAVLDLRVQVHVGDPEVRGHLERRFAALGAPGEPHLHVAIDPAASGWRLHGLGHDQVLADVDARDEALASVLNGVSARPGQPLALHGAAACSPEGSVVVLVGASGAGKSTLVGALVRAGWRYLTDEAVGIRAGTLAAVAYPKPLALDAGSRALLGLDPDGPALADLEELGVLAGAARIGAAETDAARPAVIVVPDRTPGATAGLATLAGEAALLALAANAINLAAAGQAGLATLAALAVEVPVVRLGHETLEDGVDGVVEAVRTA